MTQNSEPRFARARVKTSLKDCRLEAGLTQDELADRLELSQSYVALLETGKRPVLDTIADCAGVVFDRAFAEREANRERIDALVAELYPWSERDEARYQSRKAKEEARLRCE
jgi:transcriptional regulator with XRE-family HTH domain